MKKICIIGVGYVGLVSSACFSELGNKVIALDVDTSRIDNLRRGIIPIYEPGLDELVQRNVKGGRLSFSDNYEEALKDVDFAFIAVGTPSTMDGDTDLSYIASVAKSIAKNMSRRLIIINKSTVPVGTGDVVSEIVRHNQIQAFDFSVVSCPEFLREGTAINDFMNPYRTVLGSTDRNAAIEVANLYLPLRSPLIITDIRTAELIKYASNAFLATKISFINEMANICEAVGADVREVANGMGYDTRIGRQFLDAGLGWGGSCFPKDVKALVKAAEKAGLDPLILNSVITVNNNQQLKAAKQIVDMMKEVEGKTIGLLGLSFKENTDDVREAPSITIINELISRGANIRAYDPVVKRQEGGPFSKIDLFEDPYNMATGCDCIAVLTPWNEFKQLDMERIGALLNTKILFDGRNLYEPANMREMGFLYRGVGR